MCQSQAEGGRRCAAHTRAAFEAATPHTPGWDDAAAAYAATTEGHDRLTRDADAAALDGNYDQAGRLYSALRRGETLRAAQAEITTQTRAAAAASTAHARPSVYRMTDRDLSEELDRLVPANNSPVGPDQTLSPSARGYRSRQVTLEIADRIRKGTWDTRIATGVDPAEGTFDKNVGDFTRVGGVGTRFLQSGQTYEVYAFGRVPRTRSYGNELADKVDVHVKVLDGSPHGASRTSFRWTVADYNRAVKAQRAADADAQVAAEGRTFDDTFTTLLAAADGQH